MTTLCRRLSSRRTIRGPRLGEQRFGGGIDEGHLARCRIGALRVIHESIWVMFTGEPSTRGANLIGTRTKWHAEHLVWRTSTAHREASSSAALTAAETSASSADIVSTPSPPTRALSGAGAPSSM
jgi:hypothetical protein